MEHHETQGIYKHLKFLSIFTCVVIVLFASLLAFWNWYPYNPIDTSPDPYLIVYPKDKIVKQGGFLTYEFVYVKTSTVLPVIQRQFVDDIIFNTAGTQDPTVTEIGRGIARVQVEIPETLPPGKYYLRILATYQMNPIRQIHNNNSTESFEVVSGEHSDAEQDAIEYNELLQEGN